MALRDNDDVDGWRADQAALVDIPPDSGEDAVTGGGERSDVRHLTSGDEAERDLARQPQKLSRPGARNFLYDRRRRPTDVQPGVLIPRRRKPISRNRGRKRPTNDKPEVAPARASSEPGLSSRSQVSDHLARIGSHLRQRPAETQTQLVHAGTPAHRALRQSLKMGGSEPGGLLEQLADRHRVNRPSINPG